MAELPESTLLISLRAGIPRLSGQAPYPALRPLARLHATLSGRPGWAGKAVGLKHEAEAPRRSLLFAPQPRPSWPGLPHPLKAVERVPGRHGGKEGFQGPVAPSPPPPGS